jgi:hypothetical protein
VPELPYVGDPEEAAFQALYGPWSAWTPSAAAHVLSGWDRPWWLVGGWAIDAFTGTERQHEDIDVGILRAHVPDLQAYLGKDWHCWAAGSGGLRPLSDDDDELPEWADQCWVRRHAWAPWVADFVTAPDLDGAWVFRRDRSVVLPLEQVTWERDGMVYQNPELVLAFKAMVGRSKDDADLERTWPLLNEDQRAWLRSTVERLYPGHHWLESMR